MQLSPDHGNFLRSYLDMVMFLRPGTPFFLGIALVVAFMIATVFLAWWSVAEFGSSSSLRPLSTSLEGSVNLSALWYGEKSSAIGLRRENWEITILRWNVTSGKLAWSEKLDLNSLTPPPSSLNRSGRTPSSEAQLRLPAKALDTRTEGRGQTLQESETSRTQTPISIGVSQDGTRLAWAWRDHLYIVDLEAEKGRLAPKTIALPSGSSISTIVFGGESIVVVQTAALDVLLADTETGKVRPEGPWRRGPCALLSTGTWVLQGCSGDRTALSFDASKTLIFGVSIISRPTGKPEESGSLGFAISNSGDAAVATESGTVFLRGPDSTGREINLELRAPGVVGTMAVHGRYVAVGGGFRGIHLLSVDRPVQPIVSDVTGVTLISARNLSATNGEFLFATREQAAQIAYSEVRSLSEQGVIIAFLWGAVALVLLGSPMVRIWSQEKQRQQEAGVQVRLQREFERGLEVISASPEPAEIQSLPDPPEALVKACAAGECVAFLGAGMSAQAGLPTWRPLIHSLLSALERDQMLDPSSIQTLQAAFRAGQTDLVADGITSNLGERQSYLYEFLGNTFLQRNVALPRAFVLLRDLGLSAVLTTNFDNLMEETFGDRVKDAYTHQDAEQLLEALTKREFFILKLYGSLRRTESVLLAPFQYIEAMARNLLFSRFMESMFASRTLLFLGASLEGIEAYLTGIKFPTSMPQRHFALVAVTGSAWRAKADLLERRFGIQVLAFTPGNSYPELEQFLEKLSSAIARERKVGTQTAVRRVARLKSVRLTNIGPFDDLEVELDPKWNILLGDNGVGKSTILKAIAVGMVGTEAAPYAGRLIKSGKGDATITLRTDEGKQYITEIRRGDQRVIVESRPSRPLEPEAWLALGFPPLRSFTWAGADRDLSTKGISRLTSEDLMPLISGDTDPRLDKLKSWILDRHDQEIRNSQEKGTKSARWFFFSPGQASTSGGSLLEEFFEIIRRLTPGQRLGKFQIDSQKKEVFVETADGQVRIEALSQGTQSLLGWIGVLLERLSKFYAERQSASVGETARPLLKEFALVLMDEIDAHMHPKWQQIVVGRLKELMPECQIIATTHSPLVVVGMERNEVLLSRREGKENDPSARVVVERPSHSLRGWSADQILTGSLFGLETVLDPKIYEDIDRYTALAAKDSLTGAEEADLERLAERLKIQRPSPKQREEARLAFQMIEKALEEQLENVPLEKRKKVLDEARVQVEENVTGIRRPG